MPNDSTTIQVIIKPGETNPAKDETKAAVSAEKQAADATKPGETATTVPHGTTNRDGLPIEKGNVGLAAAMKDDRRTSVHDHVMPDTVMAHRTELCAFNLLESRDYHERVEDALMAAGHDYPEAHRVATECEHARMRQLGFDPNEIEELQKPYIDLAAHEARARGNTQSDVGNQPYIDSGDVDMREDGDDEDHRFVLDRDGIKYVDPVYGKLLGSIEIVTGAADSGQDYAVIDPHSGMVLVRGKSREKADAEAVDMAERLGRKKLQAKLDKEPPQSQQQLQEKFKQIHPEARIGAEAVPPQEKADAEEGRKQGDDEEELRGVRTGQDVREDEAEIRQESRGQAEGSSGDEGGGKEPVQEVAAPAKHGRGAVMQDARLSSAWHQDELKRMASRAGWAQIGGEPIPEDKGGGHTAWVPHEPWFAALQRESGLSGNKGGIGTREAVRRALAGHPLRAREVRHIQAMLDEADARQAEAMAFHEHGINPVEQDLRDDAVLKHALSIAPKAVQRAAKEFRNDDTGFMEAVRRIASGKRAKKDEPRSSSQDRQARTGAASAAV